MKLWLGAKYPKVEVITVSVKRRCPSWTHTPLSLGIEQWVESTQNSLTQHNNSTSKSQVFSTADNQPTLISTFFQRWTPNGGDNKTLGRFQLTDIPAALGGIPQSVTFDIDKNGIVSVKGQDLEPKRTNNCHPIKLRLTDEEITAWWKMPKLTWADKKHKRSWLRNESRPPNDLSTEKTIKELKAKFGVERDCPSYPWWP